MRRMGIIPVHDVEGMNVFHMTKMGIMPTHVLREWVFIT